MKNKKAKLIFRLNRWLRRPKTSNEMRSNSAPEDFEYIRAKRHIKRLPNLYDDIPIDIIHKSWKARSKVKKQYIKHEQSLREDLHFGNSEQYKKEFLFKLKILKNTDGIGWYYFDTRERETFSFRTVDYQSIALALYKEGFLIADFEKYEYDIANYSNKVNHIILEKIIRCRLP